jgi:hypothetical protein
MERRRGHSLFLIDIAVPRDIEEEVNEIDNVYLYNIDQLQQIANEGKSRRERQIAVCRDLIAAAAHSYDGDLEMQTAGAPPAAPWNPGPASVVRLDARAQSPFTNLYALGRLGLQLPSRAEYDGFGLALPPIPPDAEGHLHVGFDIRPGKRAGNGAGTWRYSIGHGPGPSPAIELFFDDAAFFTRDGQVTSPVGAIAAERWHQVQLVLDLAKRTYTGLLLSEGISTPFSGPLAAGWDGTIDYTFIDSYGHVGGLRPALDVDNFVVSSTPHRPEPPPR